MLSKKIKYNDLSVWLKVLVVFGSISIIWNTIVGLATLILILAGVL